MRLTDDDHEMIQRAINRYAEWTIILLDGTLYEEPAHWTDAVDGETTAQYDARITDGWHDLPMDVLADQHAERYRDEAAKDIARIVAGRALYQD
ncbi:MAG TPA: hypothetical protein VNJ04_19595 [Gemmatimonadaceae bacterium]|nr:hypothetical protein [Gemmatimonadaceae bacterium]